MGQRDILHAFVKLFDKYNISYLLTGSFAVSFYGYPRATHDIDFVVEVSQDTGKQLFKALKNLGKSYLLDFKQIGKAIQDRMQFDIYHPETGLKIDFWILKDDDFEKNKIKRRRAIKLDKQKVYLASAEDLILTKLLWCKDVRSERHLRDCTGMIKVQAENLDIKYLRVWAAKFKINKLLDEAFSMEY